MAFSMLSSSVLSQLIQENYFFFIRLLITIVFDLDLSSTSKLSIVNKHHRHSILFSYLIFFRSLLLLYYWNDYCLKKVLSLMLDRITGDLASFLIKLWEFYFSSNFWFNVISDANWPLQLFFRPKSIFLSNQVKEMMRPVNIEELNSITLQITIKPILMHNNNWNCRKSIRIEQ